MTGRVYYNDCDHAAAAWLRELIKAGLIPYGDVDERSITEVRADDLTGYSQCHFFAGIGGWALALQLAGWGDRPVWTGSCPCQPYSVAGKGEGNADARNLWPHFARLIRERRPSVVFGEQVPNAIQHGWIDGVRADLESEDYAVGFAVLGAHSVGAPHRRQRLWWVAVSDIAGRQSIPDDRPGAGEGDRSARQREQSGPVSIADRLAVAGLSIGYPGPREQRSAETCAGQRNEEAAYYQRGGTVDRLGVSGIPRLERHAGDGGDGDEPGRIGEEPDGSVAAAGGTGSVVDDGTGNDGVGDSPVGGCGVIGDASFARSGGHSDSSGGAGLNPWANYVLVSCRDGKVRRIESASEQVAAGLPAGVVRCGGKGAQSTEVGEAGRDTFPLVIGSKARAMRLRGYGNAIVPQVAAEFIRAVMDITPDELRKVPAQRTGGFRRLI